MVSTEPNYVQCVLKAQFDPTTLTGSYVALNGTGFNDTVKILKIFNPSQTIAVDISLDGVNDHDFIPPRGTLIVDFQANHFNWPSTAAGTLNVMVGQILYGKTAAQPTFLQIVGYR
jgi:hypothetical protein